MRERLEIRRGGRAPSSGQNDVDRIIRADGGNGICRRWIQELVGMLSDGQGAGLRLAAADHASEDQIGIVEHSTEGTGIAELITRVATGARRALIIKHNARGRVARRLSVSAETSF